MLAAALQAFMVALCFAVYASAPGLTIKPPGFGGIYTDLPVGAKVSIDKGWGGIITLFGQSTAMGHYGVMRLIAGVEQT